jgi:uncharacterized protein (DUF58 family)
MTTAPDTRERGYGLERRKLPITRRWLSARGRSLEITKAGMLFIGLTLAVGFAAINSGSNLLHVIFGVQLGVIVASGLLSERMVNRAVARRQLNSPLFAGAPGALRVDLRNDSESGVLFSVSVENDDNFSGGGEVAPVFCLALAPGEKVDLHSRVTMPRRGRHALPPAVVATRFPFGLFVKRREIPPGPEIVVYPRVRPTVGAELGFEEIGLGESTGQIARSGEFYGLEEYREGADLRRVNWPATARRGRLVLCEYEGEGVRTRMLDLRSGQAGDPAFEEAIEELASIALSALRREGMGVGLRVDGETEIPPGHGPRHESRILEFLATVGMHEDNRPASTSGVHA